MQPNQMQIQRLAISRDVRKTLSFEIVKLQRREVRAWKSLKLQTLLQHGGTWKRIRQLQKLQNVAMQRTTELPPPDAFADMLEEIFHGYPGAPTQPEQLDGPLCRELTFAIKRLKNNKATDECGLVAEVLRCVPHDCLNSLLQIMNEILHKKEVSRPHGVKHCSNCFPKLTVLASQLIFGPLQTYAYCTKSLLIWCLVGLKRRWSNTSLRNNMDSGAVGG